jgi:glycosyltransferase involved in cell wall biosynthesis
MYNNLLVIIPAFNEENNIHKVISAVSKFSDVLVVDDGSHDKTSSISKSLGAIVISKDKNTGYESALDTGFNFFKNSDYKYVLTIDADNQHNPEQIHDFYDYLSRGYDFVVGKRDKFQRVSEHIFSIISKNIWGIKDPLCGMKAYSKKCFEVKNIRNINSVGTKYAIISAKRKLKFKEIRVITSDRRDSPRFGAGIRPNLIILNALLMMLFYK